MVWLQTRPHFSGPGNHDTEAGIIKLVECRFVQWHDLIFVNISGIAPSFESHIERLEAHIEDCDLSHYTFGNLLEFEFKAHWKLAFENYLDVYHVFRVHPGLSAEMTDGQRYSDPPRWKFSL